MPKRRKDGNIQRQVTVNGKRYWFYGKTNAEINRKIAAWKGEIEAGPLFKDVAEEWKEKHFKNLEYNSLRNYTPAYNRAIEHFEGKYIKSIKPSDINSFITNFASKGYAKKTVSTQLLILNMVFQAAVIADIIEYNPCASARIPKYLPKTNREIPTNEEIDKVRKGVNCTFGLFAFFILYTGCRRGEALALTYGDIDLKSKLIHITKSVYHESNRPKLKYPKTSAGTRDIPLFDVLIPHVKYKQKDKEKFIFANKDGELLTETQFRRLWKLYTSETGVKCTPHQLRHAFASVVLFESNVDVKDAQLIMGHANASTTLDIYTHIRKERMDETVKKVNEKLNTSV